MAKRLVVRSETDLVRGALITSEWLKAEGACSRHYRRFRRTFPKGMTLTRENLLKALGAGLALSWLTPRVPGAHKQLNKLTRRVYNNDGSAGWESPRAYDNGAYAYLALIEVLDL